MAGVFALRLVPRLAAEPPGRGKGGGGGASRDPVHKQTRQGLKSSACVMKLPESSGRLFVAGIAPGTGDADIRRHFCRYGEVSGVCQPKDRLTGCPRGFAFVQFPRPTDAGRALAACPHHVINGQQVHVARAQPRIARYKPLCQRIYRCRKRGHYMVGDMIPISLGPLGDDYEDCEYVNRLKEFGDIVDNKLTFECCVGYISEDGKECLVRWPPVKTDGGGGKSALPSAQGDIVPSWTCPMKDLAHFASNGNFGSAHNCRYCLRRRFPASATCNYPNAVGVGGAPSVESNTKPTCVFPEAGQSQNWCWLVLYAY